MLVVQLVMQDPDGVATERASIFPPFAEREVQVRDGGTSDRELDVMPRSLPVRNQFSRTSTSAFTGCTFGIKLLFSDLGNGRDLSTR
jgi:hypothetical protein